MKLRDDILLPNGCLNLTTVKNFKLASDDVIVCSYPKSGDKINNKNKKKIQIIYMFYINKGTTWTQEIVWLLMNNFDYETAKSKSLAERYIWFDPGLTPRQMDESKPPRLIKNHLPLKFLPQNLIDSKAKVTSI